VACAQVDWHAGDALEPASFAHLLPGATAVVHTLGTLFEDTGYKQALRAGGVADVVAGVLRGVMGGSSSSGGGGSDNYERLNRDSGAWCICVTATGREPRC